MTPDEIHGIPDELLDVYAACKFLGGSRPLNPATLWRGIKAGRYSQPIKISAQAVRWRRCELQADIDRMVAERDGAEPTAAASSEHKRNSCASRNTPPDDSEDMIGHTVELYLGEIEYQGKPQEAVLVRPISKPDPNAPPKKKLNKAKADFDDPVEFE